MRERERRCAQRTQASFLPTQSCTRGIEPRDRPAVLISVCSKEPHMGRDRRERERAAESMCALCGVRPTVYSIPPMYSVLHLSSDVLPPIYCVHIDVFTI